MSNYNDILSRYSNCRLLVVGDLILDHYAFGSVNRISPEAPIQVLDVTDEEYRLGGATNVANNLVSFEAQVIIAGVIGEDENGQILLDLVRKAGIDPQGIVVDKNRPTTVKTRLIAQGQHLLRTDREVKTAISEQICRRILERVTELLPKCDVLVISDYSKGLLTESLSRGLIATARGMGKSIVVGPKGSNWNRYAGATLVSANRKETEDIVGFAIDGESVTRAGGELLRKLDLDAAVVTLGSKGIYLAERDRGFHLKSEAQEVFDVTGAGDTVLAFLSLAAAAKIVWRRGIVLANAAAGIVVAKVGASTVTREELYRKLTQGQISYLEKIKSIPELLPILARERERGQVIVLTNGCFDLLHPGHIRYLRYCRKRGDIFVVAINSDSSIRSLKGEKRPIVTENDRAEMIAALSSVDYVVIFDEESVQKTVELIHPDILIKGGDYSEEEVVGASSVREYGGEVEVYPLQEGYSTTNLVKKILEVYTTESGDSQ